jgi:PIN domain nuclease of toxin-antitoxin system
MEAEVTFLADTHVWIWFAGEERSKLSRKATEAFESGAPLVISAATYWEIAVKDSLGKLRYGEGVWNWETFDLGLTNVEAVWLAISREHARAYAALPLRHRDPFDRILVAQAQCEGFTILTRDPSFSAYDVEVMW